MEIDCVFFDFDGVLTTDATGSTSTCRYLSARTGRPLGRLKAAFARHNKELTLGLVSHENVWSDICAELDLDVPFEILTEAFDSTPVNRPMLDLAQKLRARCRVAVITDNKLDRMHRLIAVQRLDELFDPIVVSAAQGCSKSSRALFERAMAIARVSAQRSIFIDNDEANVSMAASCGMHAILFDHSRNDVEGLAARLRDEFGLPA